MTNEAANIDMTDHAPTAPEPMPRFLDFEASSLASGSYPIEVAWSNPDGSIESHLISPSGIERWTDWSVKAEQLHNIRRSRLMAEGKSPDWICRRLNEALDGETVYTDDPDYDGQWLTELYAVTWGIRPAFQLASAQDLCTEQLAQACPQRTDALHRLAVLKSEVIQRLARRHRAGWDVECLVELWRVLNGTA